MEPHGQNPDPVEEDPWAVSDPWQVNLAPAPAAAVPSRKPEPSSSRWQGFKDKTYVDSWNSNDRYNVSVEGTDLVVSCPKNSWTPERTQIQGDTVELWGYTVTISEDALRFSNGSEWVLEASQPQAQPEAQPQAANGWSLEVQQDQNWNAASQDQQAWGDQGYREPQKQQNSHDSWSSWDKDGSNGWNQGQSDQGQNSWGQDSKKQGSWGQSAPSQGSWAGQDQSSWAKSDGEQQDHVKKLRLKDFKAAQDWYKEQGVVPGPSKGDVESLFERQGQGSGEDFALYDHVSHSITGSMSEVIEECLPRLHTFEDIIRECRKSVPTELEANIKRCGFQRPTPVQKCAIPVGLAGRDVMCCAQTGSGKTAAFLVPMLASMMQDRRQTGALTVPFDGPCMPYTLIMSPTRELCVQIFEDALKFCNNTNFRVTRVYGQESAREQIHDIAKGADVCVATPGRLQDFASAGIINLSEVKCLVIDEADRMLDMGMECVIRSIVEEMAMPTKEDRQTMMFSATFPEDIQKLAQAYLFDHIFVAVGAIGSAATTVSQVVIQVQKDKKREHLVALIDDWQGTRKPGSKMLVFSNSKAEAKGLDEFLWDKNIASTGALHGDLQQADREKNLTLFRMGQIEVIVATDVASRGLDIDGVSHVVNYDLPREKSVYVQRIGRTGRIGHRGTSITFIAVDEQGRIVEQHSDEVLRDLPEIMHGAPNTEVPDWLLAKANELKEGKWDSGGGRNGDKSDARPGWEDWNQTVASYDQQRGAAAQASSWNAEAAPAQAQNGGSWNNASWQ